MGDAINGFTKFDELEAFIMLNPISVICLNECWPSDQGM